MKALSKQDRAPADTVEGRGKFQLQAGMGWVSQRPLIQDGWIWQEPETNSRCRQRRVGLGMQERERCRFRQAAGDPRLWIQPQQQMQPSQLAGLSRALGQTATA